MRPRDEATAAAAVEVLAKSSSAEARRCASAALEGLGIDPYAALAQARERSRSSGVPGPLRKDAGGPGGVVVSRELAGGRKLTLEMAPDEALDFVSAVQAAMYGRGARSWVPQLMQRSSR